LTRRPRPPEPRSGYGDVGYNHHPFPRDKIRPITPHINRLAAAGVILDRFYVADRCAPSRASLLTGRVPIHVSQNNPPIWQRGGGVPVEMATIADVLRGRGYVCRLLGKWHAGHDSAARLPVHRGFASSFGLLGGMADHYTQVGGEQMA